VSTLNRTFQYRRAWFVALFFIAICLAPVVATGAEVDSQPATTSTAEAAPAGASALDKRFTRPPEKVNLPPIPNNPVETLVTEVNLNSTNLGFPAGPGLPTDHGLAIRNAGMSEEFAGRVALLMQAVNACPPVDNDPIVTHEQAECAKNVQDAIAGILRWKEQASSSDVQTQGADPDPCLAGLDVDTWPSLYIDCDGSNDKYAHDYSQLIDTGGKDVYANNAGANLLDTQHGPSSAPHAPEHGKAIGCEHAQTLPPVPPSAPPPQDCTADRSTTLVDQGTDDDVYGQFQSPRKRDDNPFPEDRRVDGDCTNDKVVRRVVLQGAGFQGNGHLTDEGGNDRYRAKTASQGAGHIGGIGALRDLGRGDDDYLTIRSSQGFALVGGEGSGLLQDRGGNDRYHTYMPRPFDPNAWIGEPGSGGVVDDFDNCDPIPRMTQGAAIGFGDPGGTGTLLDEDGKDVYIGSTRVQQIFSGVIEFRHASQGFGCDGGIGTLDDRGRDQDTYLKGPKNNRDGRERLREQVECGFFPAPGVGHFIDDGPKKRGSKR
jgi:hypothetical protein